MKRTEPSSNRDQIRVWRPYGFSGLELGVKSSPVALRFLPSLVFDYRFVVNGHGSGQARFGSQSYRIEDVRDRVFLQHPGEVFEGVFGGPDGASGACLGLSDQLVSQLYGEEPTRHQWRFPRMVPEDRENAILATLTRSAFRAIRESRPLLEQENKLVALVEAAMRLSATRADATAWTPRRQVPERGAVIAVRRHFQELPGLDHSMHDLAELTGFNPRYLIRVFQRQTGLTPHRYLTAVRIRRAKELLLTDRPMCAIATELGFSDQAHFSRVFKAHVQVSPSQFRRLSSPSATLGKT